MSSFSLIIKYRLVFEIFENLITFWHFCLIIKNADTCSGLFENIFSWFLRVLGFLTLVHFCLSSSLDLDKVLKLERGMTLSTV